MPSVDEGCDGEYEIEESKKLNSDGKGFVSKDQANHRSFSGNTETAFTGFGCRNKSVNTIKKQRQNTIENTLDTLLSLTVMGVGKELFIRLLEYYKTVDLEEAAFYWNEYDNDDE